MTATNVIALLAVLTIGACAAPAAPRFIITAMPIDVGISRPLCIAVDPTDSRGVWWWHRGRSGCTTRSSSVTPAERPTVARPTPDVLDVSFQIPLIVPPQVSTIREVNLALLNGGTRMRSLTTGAEVSTLRRDDLNLLEATP